LNSAMFVPLGVITEIFLHNMTCYGRNTQGLFNNSLGRYFFIAVMIKLPPFITQRSKLDLALIGVTIGAVATRYLTNKFPRIHDGVHNIKPNITYAVQRVWRYIKSFFNYDLTVARVQ
jgi:hypothetical protein